MVVQWNPSIVDTIGNQHFFPYSEVFLTQGILYIWYAVLSTTWLGFRAFLLNMKIVE